MKHSKKELETAVRMEKQVLTSELSELNKRAAKIDQRLMELDKAEALLEGYE